MRTLVHWWRLAVFAWCDVVDWIAERRAVRRDRQAAEGLSRRPATFGREAFATKERSELPRGNW